ncbi:MAG: D-alanyl-D-alanine carboxypeptidase family protein [Polyangiaceae bacterium]
MRNALMLVWLALASSACSAPDANLPHDDYCEAPTAVAAEALSAVDCSESTDTGYTSGSPFPITVVKVDGKPVEKATANAYYVMAQAADKAGVTLKVVSGFRTQAEQQYLYNCYINCNCNNCNLAAKPGYSNHQSGHALDLNTSSSGVLAWLNANGASYGFKRTVPSEDWHWEWWGGGPGGGACSAEYAGKSLGLSGQSYPIVSQGAAVVEVGQTVTGWVKLENTGTATWKSGTVWLAPIPRDQPSPFVGPTWLNDHRISTLDADVPPGGTGTFALDLTGSVEGESILELGWVAEGITWFADGPKGGGPDDGYFAVKVDVVPSTGTGGGGGSSGSTGAGGGTGAGWSNGGAIGVAGSAGVPTKLRSGSGDDGGCTLSPRSAPSDSSAGWLVLALMALLRRRERRNPTANRRALRH